MSTDAVSYRVTAPLHVNACHCLRRQTRSGSAFALHATLPEGAFACTGALAEFRRKTATATFTEAFCAACHTRIFNRNSPCRG